MHIAIADGAEGVNAVLTMLVLVGNEIVMKSGTRVWRGPDLPGNPQDKNLGKSRKAGGKAVRVV